MDTNTGLWFLKQRETQKSKCYSCLGYLLGSTFRFMVEEKEIWFEVTDQSLGRMRKIKFMANKLMAEGNGKLFNGRGVLILQYENLLEICYNVNILYSIELYI